MQTASSYPRLLLCCALWLCAAAAARADVYAFIDENGVSHFSNVPQDPRYRLYWRNPRIEAPAAAPAERKPAAPVDVAAFRPHIESAAAETRLDPQLLHAVIRTESGYNPRAVSPKGALGLMQLMPDTARRYGVANAFDPAQNVRGGARYLRDLLQMFSQDLSLALAAYNAGEGAVARYGNRIPPFPETQAYVPRVLRDYQRLRAGRGKSG